MQQQFITRFMTGNAS